MRREKDALRGRRALLSFAAIPAFYSLQSWVPAHAADAGSGLEEITVTARRVAERSQDVPVAVTAFSPNALKDLGIQSVQDLTLAAPGLNILPYEGSTMILQIRGQLNDSPKAGQDASVGLYVNDVPYNIPQGTNVGLFDMQDVEVLKGPQGTLFGRNTTGGAVLLNTKKPTHQFEGYVQGGGTFYEIGGGWQGEGVVNIPIADSFAVRAGFSAQDLGGWAKNTATPAEVAQYQPFVPFPAGSTNFDALGAMKSQAWRLSALWNPTATLESFFFYQGSHMSGDGNVPRVTAVNPTGVVSQFAPFVNLPDPQTTAARLDAARSHYYWSTYVFANIPYTSDSQAVSNTTTWTLNDQLTLKNIVGYRNAHEFYYDDASSLGAGTLFYGTSAGGHDFSEELQLQGKSERLQWVVGLFYFDELNRYNSEGLIILNAPSSLSLATAKNRSYSAFAQGTAQIPGVEGLSLTLGGRYTRDRREMEARRFNPDGTCLFPGLSPSECVLDGAHDYSKPTYNLSLNYKIDPDTLVYVSASRGYRSGGFQPLPADAASFEPYQPETVDNYEIGLKRDWTILDRPLRTNLAVYRQSYKQIQRLESAPDSPTVENVINAGKATVPGGEFELTTKPFDSLQLGASVALIYPRYDEFDYNGVNLAGQTFAYVPRQQYNVNVNYKLPLDAHIGVVSVSGNYHYQGKQFIDDERQSENSSLNSGPQSSLEIAGFGTLGFEINWQGIWESPVDLNLFVHNATNAHESNNFGAVLYYSLGYNYQFLSPPRSFGMNLKYNFGL